MTQPEVLVAEMQPDVFEQQRHLNLRERGSAKIGALIAGAALVLGGIGFGIFGGGDEVAGAKAGEGIGLDADAAKAKAREICDVFPYGPKEYSPSVAPDMLRDMGHAEDGKRVFDQDEAKSADQVSRALAPNTLGLATVKTILSSETGIAGGQIASEAAQLATSMEANSHKRDEVCETVVARVFTTGGLGEYQSPTGLVTEFMPIYGSDKKVATGGIEAESTQNTAPIDGFKINAVAGSSNEVLDRAISQNWIITAEGEIIKTSQTEGQVKVDEEGNPVQPEETETTGGGGSGTTSGNGGGSGGETGGGCGGSCGTTGGGGNGGGSGGGGGGGCGSCGGGGSGGETPPPPPPPPPTPTTQPKGGETDPPPPPPGF